MNDSAQLARQWWGTLDPVDRQRVWDSRHSYLAGDLVESMANGRGTRGQRWPLVLCQCRTDRFHAA
jgi:hypothetical protein